MSRLRPDDPMERLAVALAFRGLSPSSDRAPSRMAAMAVDEVPWVLEDLRLDASVTEMDRLPRRR
ncbi:MAG: hypothetical protein JO355_09780 [Planctomycetaceae bacterium]|nr:hypothetical protein [Planctomycetaceae bacterium]MBV8384905.1 hypothetical protein [Planctomycetaceae bacterium]MBV8556614.1 hypothetical protein [Planctomycetaceae bacterium]MBV8609910.1 hypothetical protein [Singulisphaera sp.]MBV8677447.1 hypothetical protein [Planctomycetaceae bacterium]